MFSTLKQRLLLGVYIFMILSIPVGAYLASQTQKIKSSASEGKSTIVKNTPRPTLSPAKKILNDAESNLLSESSQNPDTDSTPAPSSPTIATSFGPTLSLKVALEGRPAGNQVTKLFIGIFEGETITSNPKFILSFTVDLAADGTYKNLSLAGLTTGNKYTALLKGAAQIANSAVFTMSPTVTNLNGGEAINLLSGDLNDDNVINSADYSIAQRANNENADLNKDGIVNIFDLSIINKNLGQIGVSGAWISPVPKVSTPSASLTQSAVGSTDSNSGYWIWIPK